MSKQRLNEAAASKNAEGMLMIPVTQGLIEGTTQECEFVFNGNPMPIIAVRKETWDARKRDLHIARLSAAAHKNENARIKDGFRTAQNTINTMIDREMEAREMINSREQAVDLLEEQNDRLNDHVNDLLMKNRNLSGVLRGAKALLGIGSIMIVVLAIALVATILS